MSDMPIQVVRPLLLPRQRLMTLIRGSFHDRHKKCVENTFPECGACIRLNLECLRESKRQVVPTIQADVTVEPVPTTRILDFFHDYRPRNTPGSDRLSKRQFAMKYYVNVMTQLLTVSHQYNSFLSG